MGPLLCRCSPAILPSALWILLPGPPGGAAVGLCHSEMWLASSPSCPFAPASLVRTRSTGFSFWCPAGKPQHTLMDYSKSVSLQTAFLDEVIDWMAGHVPVVQNKGPGPSGSLVKSPALLAYVSLSLLTPKIEGLNGTAYTKC